MSAAHPEQQQEQEEEEQHHFPAEDSECQACMEDLTPDNYAEYRATSGASHLFRRTHPPTSTHLHPTHIHPTHAPTLLMHPSTHPPTSTHPPGLHGRPGHQRVSALLLICSTHPPTCTHSPTHPPNPYRRPLASFPLLHRLPRPPPQTVRLLHPPTHTPTFPLAHSSSFEPP